MCQGEGKKKKENKNCCIAGQRYMQGQILKHRVAPNDRCLIEATHRRSHRVVHGYYKRAIPLSCYSRYTGKSFSRF